MFRLPTPRLFSGLKSALRPAMPRFKVSAFWLLILAWIFLLVWIWWKGPTWTLYEEQWLKPLANRWLATAAWGIIALVWLTVRVMKRLQQLEKQQKQQREEAIDPLSVELNAQQRYLDRWLRKELRLRCKQKRKFRATTNSNHNLPVAPNLLNQTFAPTAPNQVWVADLTYVATQEGWLYLAGIKDVYTCEIVGYAMGERMTKELTGKALFMALRSQRPPAGLIHHSDRGSQYCAYDYRVIQEQFGLKTSMSRKGNCYDNAPMESFWGTLKNESLSHYRFNNRDEAITVIREYIEIFYNRQRRHSRLGNISPAAFREKYHQMTA